MSMEARFDCPECDGNYPHYYHEMDGHYIRIEGKYGERVYDSDEICLDCWCIHKDLDDPRLTAADKYTKMAYLLMRGWKQVEIARAMGVHKATISKWKKKICENPAIWDAIKATLGASRVGTL